MSLAIEVLNAIRTGNYRVLYKDEVGDRVLDQLEVDSRRHEAARE
jgi:mRNA-degrading endonuclease RelE of RelBE toxin-antitoxin system